MKGGMADDWSYFLSSSRVPPVISHYALATNGDANSVSAPVASLEAARRLMARVVRWGERQREAVWFFHLRVTSISRNRAEYHECRSVSRWMAAVGRMVLPVRRGVKRERGREGEERAIQQIDWFTSSPPYRRRGAKRKCYVVSSRILATHFRNAIDWTRMGKKGYEDIDSIIVSRGKLQRRTRLGFSLYFATAYVRHVSQNDCVYVN